MDERRRYVDLRDRFSARHQVAEKYYDCLQCAEQCRHVDNNLPPSSNSNNNNNNNKNNSGATVAIDRIHKNRHLSISATSPRSGKEVSISSPDETWKTRNGRNSLVRSLARHQSTHLTPVKKRSSLARPVRVHDSFVQPRRLMAADHQGFQRDQMYKNSWWQEQRRDQPNTSNYAYRNEEEHAENGAGWPIRLRLEQMLEFTLPQTKKKKKKRKKKKTATMMLMKQQQRSRHGFQDTDRLLKVLSINNVDQDNRYNVKRCSVM